jgi:PAS domain S-box-containing protein/putative nucleotidyltransferase with HDIG domain
MRSGAEDEVTIGSAPGSPAAVPCSIEQAALLDAVLGTTPDHLYLHDVQGRYLYACPAALDALGLKLSDMVGRTSGELGFLGDHEAEFDAKRREAMETGRPASGSTAVKGAKGLRDCDYTVVAIRDADGNVAGASTTVRDVTDRVRSEGVLRVSQETLECRVRERTAELRHANSELVRTERAFAALSISNRALVRATDEGQLIKDVCDAIVSVGGYRMAWVGMMALDGSCRVLPVAASGHDDGYLDTVCVTWDDSPTGHGPGGRAIRESRPIVTRDTEADLTFFSRDAAVARAYRSLVAFPLLEREGGPFGLLVVYSSVVNAFDQKEVGLLEELSADLAFGIGSLRARELHTRMEEELVSSNARLERMVHEVAEAMGKIVEARDPYTKGHEMRVSRLGEMIALEMGRSSDEVAAVAMASLLHDIGKLRVPTEILTKPGRLSEAEFALIKEHAQAGYEILVDVSFPWPVAEIVLQHHERMDGSGYPDGVKGDAILLAARIVAVSDVVEAMASFRPYRPSLGIEAAIAEIKGWPELYDGEVVSACLKLFEDGRLDYLSVPEKR